MYEVEELRQYEPLSRIKSAKSRLAFRFCDELPLFLNAATVAKVLGIAPSSSYELMHEKDFPALRIGNRIVVPKEAFIQWVEQHTGGTE